MPVGSYMPTDLPPRTQLPSVLPPTLRFRLINLVEHGLIPVCAESYWNVDFAAVWLVAAAEQLNTVRCWFHHTPRNSNALF